MVSLGSGEARPVPPSRRARLGVLLRSTLGAALPLQRGDPTQLCSRIPAGFTTFTSLPTDEGLVPSFPINVKRKIIFILQLKIK